MADTDRQAKQRDLMARAKATLSRRRAAKARAEIANRKSLIAQGVPLPPTTTEGRKKLLKQYFEDAKAQDHQDRLARRRAKRKQKQLWIEEMHKQGRRQKADDVRAKAARKAARAAQITPPVGGMPEFKGTPDEVVGKIKRRVAYRVARTQLLADAHTSRARATYSGAKEYTWVSRRDSRVRPLHQELDGAIFAYDGDGHLEDGHPGEAHNCRCVAIPIPPPHRSPDVWKAGE